MWIVGRRYTRNDIQAAFPALDARGAVARSGAEVAVVLLRVNEPGWSNQFLPGNPPQLKMEVNRARLGHNSVLMDGALTKLLFWSEHAGGDYVHLGEMQFVRRERDPVLGLHSYFDLVTPGTQVPPT